jgi:heavy metal translocating P-type ATPase
VDYCCFGCRFAAAVTQARGEQGQVNWVLTRLGVAIFLTMNVMVFTMALWSQDLYEGGTGSVLTASLSGLFRYLALLFALPVLLLLGGPLLENAWDSLRGGRLTADLLLLLGVLASYLYSVVSVVREQGAVYFEVGCTVLVLVTLGRWLEAAGKLRTSAAIEALHKLLPDTVRVLRDGREDTVPAHELAVGDCIHVVAGERLPCDGRILRNRAALDEHVVTGESEAVVKEPGDSVFGGTLNLDGDLFIAVTATSETGTLARLIELVRAARQAKGHYERLADRVSAWFLPGVMVVALGALAVHAARDGIEQGILTGLAVVLIACPCALGLATPLAVWAALGQAARAQVLFRSGVALERLAAVRAVRLDKTGTLTTGILQVVRLVTAERADRHAVLRCAARMASSSTHGHARAILHFAEHELASEPPEQGQAWSEIRTLPGRGLAAELLPAGVPLFLGSLRLMEEEGLLTGGPLAVAVRQALADGLTVTCCGWQGSVRGIFLLQEQPRAEAREAIAWLRVEGLDVAVLTGDHEARGATLGRELGVEVEAGLLPEDKVESVVRARQRFGPVALVGDGINDAPALARSDVGMALGCGTDVSREAAAVCLLGNDLLRVPWAIDLARRTVRVIRQNLFWAFGYNALGIGLACTGRLSPVLAALAMVLSSFLVVTNSLRLGGDDRGLAASLCERGDRARRGSRLNEENDTLPCSAG